MYEKYTTQDAVETVLGQLFRHWSQKGKKGVVLADLRDSLDSSFEDMDFIVPNADEFFADAINDLLSERKIILNGCASFPKGTFQPEWSWTIEPARNVQIPYLLSSAQQVKA